MAGKDYAWAAVGRGAFRLAFLDAGRAEPIGSNRASIDPDPEPEKPYAVRRCPR